MSKPWEIAEPEEFDCPDCGAHHVVTPDEFNSRFDAHGRFRCRRCRRRWLFVALGVVGVSHGARLWLVCLY